MRASKGHSPTGEPRHSDISGHKKKASQRGGTHILESPETETSQDTGRMRASKGHSLSRKPRQRDKSEHRRNASQQGALTSWRTQTQRQVRTWKECEPARGTHVLESPDTETCQDTERMQASEGHSHPGEPRYKDKSGYGNNESQQGALTNWRAQKQTSQDIERMRISEGRSHPEEPRHRNKSEHGKNASQRGALTF